MTTIKDIARLSGYSIGTVSRVINHHPDVSEEARVKVEQVIREQNFQPNSNAKQLKQQSNSAVTIIVKGYENMFFEGILEQVQAILPPGFRKDRCSGGHSDQYGRRSAFQQSVQLHDR